MTSKILGAKTFQTFEKRKIVVCNTIIRKFSIQCNQYIGCLFRILPGVIFNDKYIALPKRRNVQQKVRLKINVQLAKKCAKRWVLIPHVMEHCNVYSQSYIPRSMYLQFHLLSLIGILYLPNFASFIGSLDLEYGTDIVIVFFVHRITDARSNTF